jgi:hypothetical protein
VVPGLDVATAIAKAQAGEIEVIPKATMTPERARQVLFTTTYVSFPSVIATRKETPVMGGLEDLKGLRVGVLRGLVVEALIKRDRPELLVTPVPTLKEALLMLSTGKLDAVVDNLGTISYGIDQLGLANLKIAAPTPYNQDMAFAVRKDMPLLRSALEKALDSLGSQERAAFKARWLAVVYHKGIEWRALAAPAAGLLALLLAFLVWNQSLRKAIRARKRVEAALQERAQELEAQAELKSRLGLITAELQKARSLEELADTFLVQCAPPVGLAYAALYEAVEREGMLRFAGGYGRMGGPDEQEPMPIGHGLIGQCAQDGKPIRLTGSGGIPVRIGTGAGAQLPREILVLPLLRAERVLGVLAVATLGRFEPRQRALLDELMPVLSLTMEVLSGHLEARHLLGGAVRDMTELQRLNQELEQKMEQLERFARLDADREERMHALQAEVDALLERQGLPAKYAAKAADCGCSES